MTELLTGDPVYIAGPYSKGDTVLNVRNAVFAADAVMEAGYVPFLPHLTHLWHLISPKPYEAWLAYDLVWLMVCKALIRIPGESSGADREVEAALAVGIQVHFGLKAFLDAVTIPTPAGLEDL